MRTVAITCKLNALLEYLDLFTTSSSCKVVQHCITMGLALFSTTAIDSIMCGTVMLSSNVLSKKIWGAKIQACSACC